MGQEFEVTEAGVVLFKQKGTSQFVIEQGTIEPSGIAGQIFYRSDTATFEIHDGISFKSPFGGSLRVYSELVAETPNGTITNFHVSLPYVLNSTVVTKNGLTQERGVDYTESSVGTGQITFTVAPLAGAIILVSYSRVEGSAIPTLFRQNYVVGTPSGAYTGSTTTFDLQFGYTPGSGSLLVYASGVFMLAGGSADYTESTNTRIVFNSPRLVGETIQIMKLGIAADPGAITGFSNLGSGADVYASITGTVANFRSFTSGSGISVTQNTNDISISNTGVLSVHADANANITGAVQLLSGTGVALVQSGNTITFNNTAITPPGGTNGSVQFNNAGAFGGDAAKFFWDDTNFRLGIGNNSPTVSLDVTGTIRSSSSVNTGTLVLRDATTHTITVQAPSPVTSYTINLPSAQGGVSTFTKNDGSGTLTWVPVVETLTGTANQIIVSASTGAVTLSTPQNIATTSSPTFLDLTLTDSSSSTLLMNGGGSISLTASTPTNGGGITLTGDSGHGNILLNGGGNLSLTTQAIASPQGGSITLTTGNPTNTVGTGGNLNLTTGNITPSGGAGTVNGGNITLSTGNVSAFPFGGTPTANGGSLTLTTGLVQPNTGTPGSALGGSITLTTGGVDAASFSGAGSTQGGSITLTSGQPANVVHSGGTGVDAGGSITLTSFTPANGGNLTLTGTGASHGKITAGGNMAIDGTTLRVDSVNHRVGIGTASPTALFHVLANDSSVTQAIIEQDGSGNAQLQFHIPSLDHYIGVYSSTFAIGSGPNLSSSQWLRYTSGQLRLDVTSLLVNTGSGNAQFDNGVTVGVGGSFYSGGAGTLITSGSFGAGIRSVTSATTAQATDYTLLCDGTSAAFTVTLPTAATSTNRIYNIKKKDSSANAITISVSGGGTIDGAVSQVLNAQYQSLQIQSDGTAWWLI